MVKKLYEHLIKPLKTGAVKPGKTGPGNASRKVWLNGRDHLEGMDLNFSWGVHEGLGEWFATDKLHVHPYPEVHFYVGLDTANVNYLGAEIECCLGQEMETYSFAEPAVVVVPAGMPHGPARTKRMYSPKGFGFYTAGLAAVPQASWVDRPVKPAESSRYAHLVKPLKPAIVTERGRFNAARFSKEEIARREKGSSTGGMKLGPGNADHLAWFFGEDLEGLNVNMDWGFFSKPGLWHRGVGAHTHPVDEILVFAGTDPENFNSLGAEIEIDLGREHERRLVDKPSVVVLPAGTPHAPIVTRWVDRPYAFFSINLAARPETNYID